MNAPATVTSQACPDPLRNPENLAENLFRTRRQTSALAAPLGAEDQAAQANEDASPTKWHLAHTSWFFETFVLQPFLPGYRTFDERFNYCFNSYYEAQGARQPRAQRGLLTRPTCSEVRDYRAHVDEALQKLFAGSLAADDEEVLKRDRDRRPSRAAASGAVADRHSEPLRAEPAASGLSRGRARCARVARPSRFASSNSRAGAARWAMPAQDSPSTMKARATTSCCARSGSPIGSSTNAEWLAFMADGGYRTPGLWLADGWARVANGRLARAALLGGAATGSGCR